MKSIAIIGAGISGLSAARMLRKDFAVTVFEKNLQCGGLVRCQKNRAGLFHQVGGHVFNSKNQTVLDWFWKHFDREKEFFKARRNAKILLHDRLIGYPIENYLYQLPEEIEEKVIAELQHIDTDHNSSYDNFSDFLYQSFGPTLYNLYFKPYNQKLWNTDLSKVPLEWLEGKLPMPDVKTILENYKHRRQEDEMVHAFFYYPQKGGSQFIIDRLAEGVNIKLETEITKISFTDNKVFLNDHFEFDAMIYCGDIRRIHHLISDDKEREGLASVKGFKTNGISNLFCETDDTDISWLYIPSEEIKANRIIYTGNFSPLNNAGKRKTCVVEFHGEVSYESMCAELYKLPGNLTPVAFNYTKDAYLIHEKDTRQKMKKLTEVLQLKNIYPIGRFAEWEYYNMDKCIESAMNITQKIRQKLI